LITSTIVIAALLVTLLYPQTGSAMDKLRQKYEAEYQQYTESLSEYCVEGSMVNYAMEASYYMFGFTRQECEDQAVDFSVLDEYGWDSDYHTIIDVCPYIAVYHDVLSEQDVYASGSNMELFPLLNEDNLNQEYLQQMYEAGYLAYLVLEFDAYGKLAVADMKFTADNIRYYESNPYRTAKRSIEQYENNVLVYQREFQGKGDYHQVLPKNFKVIYLIHQDNGFVFGESYNPYYVFPSERLYWETGAAFVILGIAVLVALTALILPFFKRLHTGWERIFCIHIETLVCLVVLGCICAYWMMLSMANTNMYEILKHVESNGNVEFMGYVLEPVPLYYCLLALNFPGWMACFFMEYVAISSVRQFLSRPGYYLRHRFLIVHIIKWMFKPFKKLYEYVTDIDIAHRLKSSIVKIVLVNFLLVCLLCCLWFLGIIGAVIYSVILYIILKKWGSKLQKQYFSTIYATQKLADGDFKITLDEELGIFTPFGEGLSKIQEGFSKAVAEEAKSQNMKTELITNVSHDLKTPLTAIITYVNLLKNPDISEEERLSYVDTLDQKTQRLKILIEDLFEVSKAQSGNIQMNFMELDVISLIKQVRLEMEDQIMNSDLLFRWNLPEEKILLKLDGQRTYRVFVNLINNILKYSMPGSRVFIDVQTVDNTVQISFRNISMAELDFDIDRLTDRFVRGDASRNTEGSGLGLAIAKSFVELQNGTFKIDVDGDLFKVILCWPK